MLSFCCRFNEFNKKAINIQNDYLLIIMHINLNNPGQQYLHVSPLLRQTDYLGPSPLLSPDQLPLMNEEGQLESSNFRLEEKPLHEENNYVQADIDDFSPPIPNPSHDFMLNLQQNQQAQQLEESSEIRRYEIKVEKEPSLKSVEVKAQSVFTLKLPNGECPPIRAMIEFLVQNAALEQQIIFSHERLVCKEDEFCSEVFKILAKKFKKLHKTKQEMTKYCMRKAFKFIADRMRRDRTHNRDVDTCMKQYFSKAQNGNNFSIPFKKNSVQKTMNSNFLKRVFSSPYFAEDYCEFLKQLKSLIEEDNDKKIVYLAEVLDKCIKAKDLKKVQGIKRLPWTRQTLMQAERLGMSLRNYAEGKQQKSKDQ